MVERCDIKQHVYGVGVNNNGVNINLERNLNKKYKLPERLSEPDVPRNRALPHHTKHERPIRAAVVVDFLHQNLGTRVHRGGHAHRQSPPAAKLARCRYSGPTLAHPL